MIPYDDLVAALQAWRARQGLAVSTQAPAANTSNGRPSAGHAAQRPGTPPPMPAPAAKRPTTAPRLPLPLAADADLEVEPSLIEESHYENEGDDFAMSFGGDGGGNGHGHAHHQNGEKTIVGGEETIVGDEVEATDPARSHNTRDDW